MWKKKDNQVLQSKWTLSPLFKQSAIVWSNCVWPLQPEIFATSHFSLPTTNTGLSSRFGSIFTPKEDVGSSSLPRLPCKMLQNSRKCRCECQPVIRFWPWTSKISPNSYHGIESKACSAATCHSIISFQSSTSRKIWRNWFTSFGQETIVEP